MNVFAIIFPVIFVTALGYTCARRQFIDKHQIDGLSKLTFNIILPAFLFVTMATTNVGEIFDPGFVGAFYLPVLSSYALLFAWHYFTAKEQPRSPPASAVFAMGNTYSNVVLLGLPVSMAALGDHVAPYVFIVLSFHGIIMIGFTNFCGTLGLPDDGNKPGIGKRLLTLASNPILATIIGGMLYNISGLPLPDIIAKTLHLLGKPGITCALFVLGTALHYYSVKGKVGQIATQTTVKLIIMPFLVWLSATYLFELSHEMTVLVVLLSASPTGVNAYMVASGLKQQQALIASTVVVSTTLCMFSFAGWLMFLL